MRSLKKIANVAMAYIAQVSNLAFGIIITPFLARVLSVDGYGLFSLSVGISTALWIVVDWGFAMGSTKETVQGATDKKRLQDILWTTIYGKTIIGSICAVFLYLFTNILDAQTHSHLLLPGLFTIIGAILNVDWLAVSLGKFAIYMTSTFVARLITLLLIVLLVHSPSDAYKAAVIQGLSYTIVGVVGLVSMIRHVNIVPVIVKMRRISAKLLENSHYCFNRSSSLIYVSLAPVVISMRAGAHELGIYSGADKIVRVILTLLTPLATVFFPYINKKMIHSKQHAAEGSGVFFVMQFIITAVVGIGLVVTATTIVPILFGSRFNASAHTLMILSPYPMLSCLASAVSNQFAVPLGHKGKVSAVTFCSAVLYTIACFWFVGKGGADGAAWALLVGEGSLFAGVFAFLWVSERDYMSEAFQLFRPSRLWTWVMARGVAVRK